MSRLPARPAEPKRWWLLPLLVAIAVFAAAVGLVARDFYQRPGSVAAGPPTSSVTVSSSTTSAAPAQEPGSAEVQLSADTDQHPLHEQVRQVLQTFFSSINAHSYDRWRTAVTAVRARDTPRSQWLHDYQSTQDGSIEVYRIESASGNTLRVLLSFVSTQDLSAAPVEFQERCIQWHVVFPMTIESGSWRIDTGPTGKSPQHAKC